MMIREVFTFRGQTKTVPQAYGELKALHPGDLYADKKAAGSLGGSSRWGFTALRNGNWVRQR